MVMGVNMRTGQIEIAEYDGQIRGQMNLSDFTEEEQQQEEAAGQQEATAPEPGKDFDPETGEIYEPEDDRRTADGQTEEQPKNGGKIVVMERATAQA